MNMIEYLHRNCLDELTYMRNKFIFHFLLRILLLQRKNVMVTDGNEKDVHDQIMLFFHGENRSSNEKKKRQFS